jgi:uncharacterized protein involved in outer membrane biogenesis
MRIRSLVKVTALSLLALALALALAVAAVAVVFSLDPNDHKDRLAALVSAQLGREVSFDGMIDLKIGMTTKLIVRDVALANAAWASSPSMLKLTYLEIDLRLGPLLTGFVDIEQLELRGMTASIETAVDGRNNLDFLNPSQGDSDSVLLPLEIAQFRLEDFQLDIVDRQTNTASQVNLEQALALPSTNGGPLDVDVRGELRLGDETVSIELTGQIGTWDAIFAGSGPVPVDLTGTVLGLDVEIDGGVREPDNPDGFDVSIAILGDAFGTLDSFVSPSLPDLGQIEIRAHLTGHPLNPVFEDIVVEADHVRITGRADVDVEEQVLTYNVKMVLDDQQLGVADAYAELPLGTLGPIDGMLQFTGDLEEATIVIHHAEIGKTVLTGSAALEFGSSTSELTYDVTAAMQAQSVDIVRPFLDIELPVLAPMTGKVQLTGNLEQMRIAPNGVQTGNINLTGSLDTGLSADDSDLAYDVMVDLAGQALDILTAYVADLPAVGPVTGKVQVSGDDKDLRLDLDRAQFLNSEVSGVFSTVLKEGSETLSYDLSLIADGQSLTVIRPYVEVDLPDIGPFSGAITAKGDQTKLVLGFDNVTVEQTAVSGEMNLDGTADEEVMTYDLEVTATGQGWNILEAIVDFEFPDVGTFDLSVSLKGTGEDVAFEDLVFSIEESSVTGAGRVIFSDPQPEISGTFETQTFDVTHIYPDANPAALPATVSPAPITTNTPPSGELDPAASIFPQEELPLDFLRTGEIDVALKAGELITPFGTYRNIDTRIVLESDVLSIRPLAVTYEKSDLRGTFSLDARAETPLLVLSLRTPNLQVGQLLRDFLNLDVLEGQGVFDSAVSGTGQSIAEIAGNLNGHMRLLMANGRMRNEGLGYVSGVFSGISEMLSDKKWVAVECLASDFQIVDGIATSKVGVLDTDVIAVSVTGDIDLKKERYNLKVKPSPRGLDLSLAVPVDVRGPLGDPRFSLNPVGTLAKIGKLLGSVLFPPAALIGLVELGGNSHPCVQFAKDTDGQSGATPSSPLQERKHD